MGATQEPNELGLPPILWPCYWLRGYTTKLDNHLDRRAWYRHQLVLVPQVEEYACMGGGIHQ